ncbi:MAG: PEGA domain-containing protein [Deltaproteobacteria bacterium]|jgi:tetratricopeptide (TPR) repeat protein|nr:PEGA domain-containing protein [Deltaproteobacteria bacterium]
MKRLVILLFFTLVFASSPAVAQKQRANELHEKGRALYLKGQYREALKLFEQSYAAYKHPNTCYALGETYRRLGQNRKSYRYYKEFAATLVGEKREAFEAKLEKLRVDQPGQLDITTAPPGAAVTVDSKLRGTTPTKVALEGGEHQLVLDREGYQQVSRALMIEFGETVALHLRLSPVPNDDDPKLVLHKKPPALKTSKPIYKRWWFWTGLAAVTAGAVVATIAITSSSDSKTPQGPVFEFNDFDFK